MADTSAPPDLTPTQIFTKHAAAIGFSLSAGTEEPYLMKTTTKWSTQFITAETGRAAGCC